MIYIFNGMTFAMLLFIVASGLNIALGFLGVLNFSHGALFLLGAYVTYSVTEIFGSFWPALFIAPLIIGLLGGLIEAIFLRPLYRRHHIYTILLTFGMILVFYDLIKIIWGADVKTVAMPAGLSGTVSLFGEVFPIVSIFTICAGLITALGLWLLFDKTKLGRILRAVSMDREIAGALGFNVPMVGTIAFMLGAALAGFAGTLGSLKLSIVPGADAEILIYCFAIVVIGGVGSFRGTFVSSLIVGEMHVLGGVFFPDLAMSFVFILLVVFLSILPRGLFGREIEQAHIPIAPYTGGIGRLFRWLSPGVANQTMMILVFLVLAFLPAWLSQYTLLLWGEILIFSLFAISFNLLFGFTGMLSFGQASIFSAGAYGIAILSTVYNISWSLAFMGSLIFSVLVTFIFGIFSIRRSEIYFGMLTLAFAQLFYSIIFKWNSLTGGADGFSGIAFPRLEIFNRIIEIKSPINNYYFMLFFVGISYLIIRRIIKSPFGQIMTAIRENPDRAEYMGLNTRKYKLIVFMIAGFFAGLSGALFAPFSGTIDPLMSHWSKSGEPIFMSLIGGISTLFGPGLGTYIYYTFNSFIISITEYWQLIMGLLLITIVMVFPIGITGFCKKIILSFTRKCPGSGY
ncbi:MAG: ABC transporter permease [Desulfobacteraceae bacterium]|nr:ABC transporter permease [Desulfobacteraceae bacterium]